MDFLKYRYVFMVLSLIVIITGVVVGITTGFRFDIDFKGGTKIQVDLKTSFDNHEIESLIEEVIGTKPLVQKMTSGESTVSITTNVIPQDKSDEIVNALKTKYPNMDEPSVRNIQASFGKDLINSSIVAIVAGLIFILIYIYIRFKALGFTAAITALISLVHDVLIMIAFYGLFKFPINSTFVAVILTIIGYSINDTIIVYDRIRENGRKVTKSSNLKDIINTSMNQTMTRTICTSLTVVLAISIVLGFAYYNNQQVLIEFSLPLTVGILTGTYSSIFIASSGWYIIDEIKQKRLAKKIARKTK